MSKPQVLIVGAGAVGKTFAYHLKLASAHVGFYVKPKYVEQTKAPATLLKLRMWGAPVSLTLEVDEVLSELAQLEQRAWDYVILTVSSTALKSGDWFERFAAKLPSTTVIVTLQPGVEDRAFIERAAPDHPLVQGMIGFIAYEGPLPTEKATQAGLRFWFPPTSPTRFDGEHSLALVKLLKAGSFEATKSAKPVEHTAAFLTALMMPALVALELEQWSLKRMSGSSWAKLAHLASEQAYAALKAQLGAAPPTGLGLINAQALGLGLKLAPTVAPLPLEQFFHAHFSKVGEQTLELMRSYVELAHAHALPSSHLQALIQALEPLRASQAQ